MNSQTKSDKEQTEPANYRITSSTKR